MKIIIQLRKNAYAVDLSCAKVKIRDSRDEDFDDEEDEECGESDSSHRQDPSGTVYSQIERAQPDVDMSRTHHVDEVRARKFGFQRGS